MRKVLRMRRNIVIAFLLLTLASATPVLATVVNVGGGTWNYGSSFAFPIGKNVWSHYVHPSYYHSATAIIGPHNVKVYATASNWANADTSGGTWETAYTYWATYP